jgi:hypothetical protein
MKPHLVALLPLALLAACGSRDAGTLKPQDAARWLDLACGVRFAQDPVVLRGALQTSPSTHGPTATVSATVVLPVAEVDAVLQALRNNRSLHRRGQSETRYSYESFPDIRPEKECELDTSLHVLYFKYRQ